MSCLALDTISDEYPTTKTFENKIEQRKQNQAYELAPSSFPIRFCLAFCGSQLYGRPHLADFSATRASRRLSG